MQIIHYFKSSLSNCKSYIRQNNKSELEKIRKEIELWKELKIKHSEIKTELGIQDQ